MSTVLKNDEQLRSAVRECYGRAASRSGVWYFFRAYLVHSPPYSG
jgi:hypothetical protein